MKKVRKSTDMIYTVSGQEICPKDPIDPSSIKLADIAYGLSNIMRYNGQTRISVLRHSLAVAANFPVGPKKVYALLHDAAEAYIMDVPVPKKCFMNDFWIEVYHRFDKAIFSHVNCELSEAEIEEIKRVDKKYVEYEMRVASKHEGGRFFYPNQYQLSDCDMRSIDRDYRWLWSDSELAHMFFREFSDSMPHMVLNQDFLKPSYFELNIESHLNTGNPYDK